MRIDFLFFKVNLAVEIKKIDAHMPHYFNKTHDEVEHYDHLILTFLFISFYKTDLYLLDSKGSYS